MNGFYSYENTCNNCGKKGHQYHQCKMPIMSIGIIAFRINAGVREYLMIRRKDTLGFMEFMRGKYSVYNKYYILNLMNEMTAAEKDRLIHCSFDEIWKDVWKKTENSYNKNYKMEENISSDKFQVLKDGIYCSKDVEFYNLKSMVEESNRHSTWIEAEWGFPKGRRNSNEKDYECAIREFSEETGYKPHDLKNVNNIIPFEEIFTGSNFKSYKHKYYLMYMDYSTTLQNNHPFDDTEVSKIEWKTYDDCIQCMRPYNLEKINLINHVESCLTNCHIVEII